MYHVLLLLLSLLVCGASCSEEELWGEGGSDDDIGGGTDDDDDGGGVPAEFAIYGVNVVTASLFTIDPNNGRLELIGPLDDDRDVFSAPTAMAVRESDDAIFVWNDADGETITGVLLRVDRCTGLGTPVNPRLAGQGQLDAIAFQGSRLFGVGPAQGSTTRYTLYEVITSSGIKTLVGGTLPRMAGLAADPFRTLHGLEQMSGGTAPLGLYTIDTVRATAMRIADLDDRVVSGASLAFDGDVLLGTGQHRNGDPLFFEIDPMDGDISGLLALEQVVQGIGVSATCSPTDQTPEGVGDRAPDDAGQAGN